MKLRLLLALATFTACTTTLSVTGNSSVDTGSTVDTSLASDNASSDTGSSDSGSGTDASSSSDTGSAKGAPFLCPKKIYKTLVVVGDSISDVGGGGSGQQPFYRTLLVQNDDKLYPEWKGFDLSTCWGLDPKAGVVKVSKGGAVATEGKPQSVLFEQVKAIPMTLEGPVLVVGTIGGNDVQAGLINVVIGTPAQAEADIAAFIKGSGDAMGYLTTADRFGAGVHVDVLITNIYDPTGGSGDFTFTPKNQACGGMFTLWPKGKTTDEPLKPWNDAMQTEADKYPGVHLLDLHAEFIGHQVSKPDPENWYHDDCIHPNAAGHEHIRELFWTAMLGL